HLHLRAVLGRDHPAANQVADLVGGKLDAGEHRKHARHRRGSLGFDALDPGMGVGRAQEIGVALARTIDVIGVMALARHEALILFAADRRADSRRIHGDLLLGARAPLKFAAAGVLSWPWRRPRWPSQCYG